jgi:branched-chain amino acid transport system substrate-binding protein
MMISRSNNRRGTRMLEKTTRSKSWLLMAMLALALLAALAAGCGEETTTTTAVSGPVTTGGTATTVGSTPSGDPVVIGAIVSATGPNSPLGDPERKVLEMMQTQINAAGGVLGRPLEIVIEDDKSDAKEAVTAANRLIDQEKAVALIAASGSASTMAVKEIAAAKGLPQMAMAAGNDVTAKAPMEWIWRTPQSDAMAVARALTYISETLKVTKIAVLHDENAFGTSGATEIANTAADYGLEVVATESYKTDDTDMTAQLTKIKGANPEALVVWGTNPGPALAAKNMKQLSMTIPYIASHGIANAKFIELAGDAAEGVVFPAGRLLVPASITDPKQKEVTDGFIAAYKAAYDQSPNPFAGYAFEAIAILVDAIERAGGTDPAALQAALNATQGFVGPDGVYNYSETNHDGLTAADMIMVKIEGGTWVLAE